MDEERRDEIIREVFQEICGDKGEIRQIIIEPSGYGDEDEGDIEFFTIRIQYSGDKIFIRGKSDEIRKSLNMRFFDPSAGFPVFDEENNGILDLFLDHVG